MKGARSAGLGIMQVPGWPRRAPRETLPSAGRSPLAQSSFQSSGSWIR